MQTVGTIAVTLLIVAAFDWLFANRLAALAPSVDYRYWPLSKLRWYTVAFLAGAALTLRFVAGPTLRDGPEWPVSLLLVAFVAWGGAVMAELDVQRDRMDRPARRYSDREL
jgi:hypothetical protein